MKQIVYLLILIFFAQIYYISVLTYKINIQSEVQSLKADEVYEQIYKKNHPIRSYELVEVKNIDTCMWKAMVKDRKICMDNINE